MDANGSDTLFTVFDWELLANWPFVVPRNQILSPYAKFEVEMAKNPGTDGLVHIRSCQNNKYWVAGSNSGIAAAAKTPEEDQSNESCTLFKLISVDDATSKVRIRHVQSKRYLRIIDGTWHLSAESEDFDDSFRDVLMIIDWESPVILPKYVAFKGTDDWYLCLRDIDGLLCLQFASDDIGDSGVAMEIFMNKDGNIRIKPASSNKFWRRSSDSVLVDSDYTSSVNNMDTLFRPVKDVQLRVEEPVLGRKIFGMKYDLDNARIYDETVLVVARNSASNYTNQAETFDVKLSYTDTKTSSWMWQASLKLGAKVTMDFGIPLIFEGKVEFSGEAQGGSEWGETT
ncbi:hypothetical protein V6N12_027573 [Hibiscus sabdariffa]|uniref:Agglutinin domain-containing protein n=1 Tax=Hibiscus sabdariffa TaxID=183260 RepID=A0ABR2F394_9ROSI